MSSFVLGSLQDHLHYDFLPFTQCTILFPSSDVLQTRRYEANLMTCLLYDPYLKALYWRIASASTLATMLEGHAYVFLQVVDCCCCCFLMLLFLLLCALLLLLICVVAILLLLFLLLLSLFLLSFLLL
ncbi:unnamed protein product [Lactuca virosa]|uniref:DUF4042 domain-containing protein n=1 Tax=Lactuca virosa TaxID=75947 RepID=A0AAU9LYY2_9ASTR|nr:unnamed protein product [Lactuca virosa]